MDQSANTTKDVLATSVPLFDPSAMPLRQWCSGSREDPLTGLVAFPDFHTSIPRALAAELEAGGLVALAIGDVDGLKEHVEQTNATDAASFGHLAGNQVMARLGATTRTWFRDQSWAAACAATFGGDEVIIAAAVEDPAAFHRALCGLRDRLTEVLPTRVSFALAVAGPGHLPAERKGNAWKHEFTDHLLAAVDRCLFAHKAARRTAGTEGGVIAVTEAPGTGAADALQPLPGPDQVLHVTARPGRLGGRPVLLLPCQGPAGLRGRRLRVSFPQAGPRTLVVVSAVGQAALPVDEGADAAGVALVLGGIREAAQHSVPDDLSAALAAAGADWAVLPEHERAQMLHLITESADPQVRADRMAAAVVACTRSPK
ncbi:nucleotidyl cyclase domain-containing protein [Streptacidiphilus fuscans]|uniref:GGDEF domain-containing protein n=1 Tax=Streptacidiphilus fuscans TaxID=2789292 RepID=A0A931FFL7_9ACTN|nr:hypothetical protein [Streptacidiphilus fuscans]MBF9071748.1 hypothetical protein [Streptacidiphilus fuscans]